MLIQLFLTFPFNFKVWKEITHVKQVNINPQDIKTFVSAVNHIGIGKGCLLIQFPGSITFEYYKEVNELLQLLHLADGINS